MTRLADVVNVAYGKAEADMWREGNRRTTNDEMAESVRAGEIVVARIDEQAVGCARVRALDTTTWEFGMLAAADEARGLGVGRALVDAAESLAVDAGADTMQLALLVPLEWNQLWQKPLRTT